MCPQDVPEALRRSDLNDRKREDRPTHSSRNATMGWMFAARCAGKKLAGSPTKMIPAIADASVRGSLGFSLESIEAAAVPAAIVRPVPATRPMPSRIAASRNTMQNVAAIGSEGHPHADFISALDDDVEMTP